MQIETIIGLIGECNDTVAAHRAIPLALQDAARQLALSVRVEWLPTARIAGTALDRFDGLWCVPASPYADMDGALRAIGHARIHGVPFLGTCGGFQHALVEYARNVLGWRDAEHAESAPGQGRPVITPLACALVEQSGAVAFTPGSRIAAAYGALESVEGYHCSYGLNPAFRDALLAGPLHVTAVDGEGAVRAVELDGHPFFVATLFQPERAALAGRPVALAAAFLHAAAHRAGRASTS